MVVVADGPLWTDVVQAVGTVAAALLTAVSVFLLVLDTRRRNREQRDSEAAQARQVTIRIHYRTQYRADPLEAFDLELSNDSSSAIRHVTAFCAERANPSNKGEVRLSRLLSAGESVEGVWSPERAVPRGEKSLAECISVTLRFEDAAGLVWERVDNGQPRRLIQQR